MISHTDLYSNSQYLITQILAQCLASLWVLVIFTDDAHFHIIILSLIYPYQTISQNAINFKNKMLDTFDYHVEFTSKIKALIILIFQLEYKIIPYH